MTTIIGRYAFRESDVIGTGQYGKVYKGYHIDTKEKVAIKVIPAQLLQQSYFKTAYQNEVGSLSKLHSPYIVSLLDIQSKGDKVYLITEFCEGGDLSSYLARKKHLPEADVLDILWQIVQAFKEMKKFNLLHRDLKPANILISKGQVKVADLGFSKHVQNFQYSISQSYVGSPIYMSPQILFKQTYTSKADVWSLGIMLYELLYGGVPWNALDINELAFQVRTQPVIFHNCYPVSIELKDLITRCIRYEERDRISWEDLFAHPAVAMSRLAQRPSTPPKKTPSPPSTGVTSVAEPQGVQQMTKHSSVPLIAPPSPMIPHKMKQLMSPKTPDSIWNGPQKGAVTNVQSPIITPPPMISNVPQPVVPIQPPPSQQNPQKQSQNVVLVQQQPQQNQVNIQFQQQQPNQNIPPQGVQIQQGQQQQNRPLTINPQPGVTYFINPQNGAVTQQPQQQKPPQVQQQAPPPMIMTQNQPQNLYSNQIGRPVTPGTTTIPTSAGGIAMVNNGLNMQQQSNVMSNWMGGRLI